MKENTKSYLLCSIMFIFGVIFIYTTEEFRIISALILIPLFTIIAYLVGEMS